MAQQVQQEQDLSSAHASRNTPQHQIAAAQGSILRGEHRRMSQGVMQGAGLAAQAPPSRHGSLTQQPPSGPRKR